MNLSLISAHYIVNSGYMAKRFQVTEVRAQRMYERTVLKVWNIEFTGRIAHNTGNFR
jgi:hypothetical protein